MDNTLKKNIIINASPLKCGTTSLYTALCKSSSICGGSLKEPRYFSNEGGEEFGKIPEAMRCVGNYDLGQEWFASLFDLQSEDYIIDFSPTYSITKSTPKLIHSSFPDAKVFFVVRNPVERFVSHYYQYTKVGVALPSIKELIDKKGDVFEFLMQFCNYKDTFERFSSCFGEENICLIDFADLKANNKALEKKVNNFLGIDDFSYNPNNSEMNKLGSPKFRVLQSFMFSDSIIKIGRKLPPEYRLRGIKIRRILRELNTKQGHSKSQDQNYEEELIDILGDELEFYSDLTSGKW